MLLVIKCFYKGRKYNTQKLKQEKQFKGIKIQLIEK